jgi:hypothetical protein
MDIDLVMNNKSELSGNSEARLQSFVVSLPSDTYFESHFSRLCIRSGFFGGLKQLARARIDEDEFTQGEHEFPLRSSINILLESSPATLRKETLIS